MPMISDDSSKVQKNLLITTNIRSSHIKRMLVVLLFMPFQSNYAIGELLFSFKNDFFLEKTKP